MNWAGWRWALCLSPLVDAAFNSGNEEPVGVPRLQRGSSWLVNGCPRRQLFQLCIQHTNRRIDCRRVHQTPDRCVRSEASIVSFGGTQSGRSRLWLCWQKAQLWQEDRPHNRLRPGRTRVLFQSTLPRWRTTGDRLAHQCWHSQGWWGHKPCAPVVLTVSLFPKLMRTSANTRLKRSNWADSSDVQSLWVISTSGRMEVGLTWLIEDGLNPGLTDSGNGQPGCEKLTKEFIGDIVSSGLSGNVNAKFIYAQ